MVIAAYFLFSTRSPVEVKTSNKNTNTPDSRFDQFVMTLLTKDQQQLFLTAEQASRFSDGRNQFVKPDLKFELSGSHWQIDALEGVLQQKEYLQFDGDVKVVRRDQLGQLTHMQSKNMYIDLNTKIVTANRDVTVSTNKIMAKADKLILTMQTQIVNLSGGVKVEYAFP